MSDDTPTQRYPEGFPPPGGSRPPQPEPTPQPSADPIAELPTERFDAATPAVGVPPSATGLPPAATIPPAGAVPPGAPGDDGGRRQRGLIIGLIVAAGVLLLALIGVLVWLAVSGSPTAAPTETPTASATPSETPTPTPTPTPAPSETEEPPPPPPPPAEAIASFTASLEQVDCTASGGEPVPLTFSWAASGARLWFGVGTDDAKANPFSEYPLNYTMDDVSYQCGQPGQQQRYTITVERSDGGTESKTLIIREL